MSQEEPAKDSKFVRENYAIKFHLCCLIVSLLTLPGHRYNLTLATGAIVRQTIPRSRPIPANTILLDNGSTTFVSSLEEFMAKSSLPTPAPELGALSSDNNSRTTSQYNLSNTEGVKRQMKEKENSTKFSMAQSAPLQQLEREKMRLTFMVDIARNSSMASKSQKHHNHDQQLSRLVETELPAHSSNNNTSQHRHGEKATNSGVIKQHWQIKSLLNVTQDYPLAYSQIICGYVWPLMAALTLFTNLMIVFVLTQPDMRTPTNVVLTAIAIADIIPIVVPVPWFVYLFAMGNEKQVLFPPIACYTYQHSTRSVSEVFYFLSTWLNLLLAIQDYLTACRPKLAKKYCQIKVVVCEIVSLTLLAFLINLPQALKLVYKPVKFYYNGQVTHGCKAAQAKWFKDLIGEYAALYDDIFTGIIVVFVDGGPAIALITLTALLIRQLQRQRIQGHLLMEQARTASKRRRERHRQQEYEASARVMIFVLVAFLVVKIPFATTYTLMIIQSRFGVHFVENLNDFQKAITLTDLVFVLSYPLNFTIFCCCSKKFRHKCAQLLGECNRNTNAAKARWMSRISGSYHGSIGSESSNYLYKANQKYSISTLDTIEALNSIKSKLMSNSHHHLYNGSNESYDEHTRPATNNQRHGMEKQVTSSSDELELLKKNPCDAKTSTKNPRLGESDLLLKHNKNPELEDEIQAFLDDGSICMECIARYEKMKREHLECRLRSLSTDSAGVNSCPPPPPPLVSCPIPHIVTTRCESIREHSNGSEEDENSTKTSERSDESLHKRGDTSQRFLGRSQSEQPVKNEKQVEDGEIRRASHEFALYNKASMSTSVEEKGRAGKEVERRHNNLMEPKSLRRNTGLSSARVSSDPGANFSDQVKSGDDVLRRSDIGLDAATGRPRKSLDKQRRKNSRFNYQDEEEDSDNEVDNNARRYHADLSLIKIQNKHRSLSMSNSKLSALPSATGLLADIIKTTLLTTSNSSIGRTSDQGSNSCQNSPLAGSAKVEAKRGKKGGHAKRGPER